MNGARHPSQAASPPARIGPRKAPTALASRWKRVDPGPRCRSGYQSAISELWVGPTVACPMPGPRPHEHEHPRRDGQAGADREAGEDGGTDQHEANPVVAIGHLGDRHLQRQAHHGGDRDHREDAGVRQVEGVADVGQQDPERGVVHLVDHVEAEQDQQRVDRATAGEVAEPVAWVPDGRPDPRPNRGGTAAVPREEARSRRGLHVLGGIRRLRRSGARRRHGPPRAPRPP